MRESHLYGRVLKVADVGTCQRNVLIVAGADLPAFLCQRHQLLRGLDHVLGNLELQPDLTGSEPVFATVAARDCRPNSKSACAEA